MKTTRIDIKGSIPSDMRDMWLQKSYADIKYGYGYILFYGDDEKLSDFLDECNKDHTYFKVIGVHDAE